MTTIKTNHVRRDVIGWHDLTPTEQKEHDYLDTEDRQDGARFVRYMGYAHYLNDFQRIPKAFDDLAGWDGYANDSYFSGVLVRYVDDSERVIMGRFYA